MTSTPLFSKGGLAGEEGFSLVELMVVIVILGLLATLVVINVMPAADRAAVTALRPMTRTESENSSTGRDRSTSS